MVKRRWDLGQKREIMNNKYSHIFCVLVLSPRLEDLSSCVPIERNEYWWIVYIGSCSAS
jgi:hypothetical protein